MRNRGEVGRPLTGQYTLGNKLAKVGQLVVNKDQNDAMSVMVANGTIPLTPFAAAVYQAVAPDGLGKPVTVANDDLARIQPSDTKSFVPVTTGRSRLPQPGQWNSVRGARDRRRQAGPDASRPVTSADSPFVKPTNKQAVYVQPGRGALVRASSTGTSGPVAVVDQSGQAFTVTDPSAETLARLGYKDLTPRDVPPSWVSLIPAGPALSEAAVGAPKIDSPS